jgi:cob(I)alamin adenosyltransferase
MVKLNRIYTRTGDAGETGLVDGSRCSKSAARMDAIGTVDEANSAIGVALLAIEPGSDAAAMLGRIQNELFDLGADLATPLDMAGEALRILPGQVERLEREIDGMNAALAPLTSFILPGGGAAAAHLHLARAIVRRAERHAVAASREDERGVGADALRYLNRLSDHLFTLCRTLNAGCGDPLWQPGATR